MIAVSEVVSYIPSWYDAYHIQLTRLAVLLGHQQEDAEDLVSQFFLELMEKNIDEATIVNPKAYLTTAFKRRLIDVYRKTKTKLFVVTDELPVKTRCSQPTVQETMEQMQTSSRWIAQLRKAYEVLPERCKKVIYLKFYEGLSNDQIALQTGLSRRSVYNNVFEGVKLLRKELADSSLALDMVAVIPMLALVSESLI